MTQLQIIRDTDGNLYRVSNENLIRQGARMQPRKTTMHAMDDVI